MVTENSRLRKCTKKDIKMWMSVKWEKAASHVEMSHLFVCVSLHMIPETAGIRDTQISHFSK